MDLLKAALDALIDVADSSDERADLRCDFRVERDDVAAGDLNSLVPAGQPASRCSRHKRGQLHTLQTPRRRLVRDPFISRQCCMRAAVPQLAAALPPQPIASVSVRLRKYVILLTSRSWHRRCSVERVLKASLQIARRADFTQTFQE